MTGRDNARPWPGQVWATLDGRPWWVANTNGKHHDVVDVVERYGTLTFAWEAPSCSVPNWVVLMDSSDGAVAYGPFDENKHLAEQLTLYATATG